MNEDDLTRQIEAASKAAIEALDAEIKALEARRRLLVMEFQCTCSHRNEDIVERMTTPPARVCTICGLAEEGWHCGYKLLNLGEEEYRRKVKTVSWKEFMAYQRGRLHENGNFVGRIDKRARLRSILMGEDSP